MFKKSITLALLGTGIAIGGILSTPAMARDQIRIVGSSTVYPFAATVAEQFGKKTRFKTPIVESTGSGGGLKLFCAGAGLYTPDFANVSRRIKPSEVELCAKNGVTDITEVKVGYDGIVLANSRTSKQMNISLQDLFLALAKDVPDGEGKTKANPFKTWNDINPDLPAIKIEVLGPPPTSGTRDAFVELAMEGGCNKFDWIKAMKKKDEWAYKSLCHTIREDGAFVEAGENDNLIVRKLVTNPDAFGIFGFGFLDQNTDLLQGSVLNGVEPEFENISDGSYPVSRSLFFYIKTSHVGQVPGLRDYVAEFTSDAAMGEEGYLADKGLIPMPADEYNAVKKQANDLVNLSM